MIFLSQEIAKIFLRNFKNVASHVCAVSKVTAQVSVSAPCSYIGCTTTPVTESNMSY